MECSLCRASTRTHFAGGCKLPPKERGRPWRRRAGVRMEVEQRNLVKMQKKKIIIILNVTVMKMANLCSYLGCKNPAAFQPGFFNLQTFSETYLLYF